MKIIAIIDFNRDGTEIIRTIGRLSPQDTFLDLQDKIQEEQDKLGAEEVTRIRLDMET